MKKTFLGCLFLIMLFRLSSQAQTSGYQAGQQVEAFSLLTGTGQKIALADHANNKAVVVVFTNSHCAYAQLYQKRLQQLSTDYAAKGVKFIYVQPAISTDNTTTSAQSEEANSAYAVDANQKISQQWGATKTPEVFVLQPENGKFTLRYKGAIDDNPQMESYVKENYLKNALDAVLANQIPAVTHKRATGCSIKRF